MASPGTPKTMSSRLLTMKFMQRAAASSPSSNPSTPPSNDQSSKRRKVSHNPTPPQNVDTLVNQASIQAAIAEEEKKVEHALLKRAEELGDAHWVLDVPEQVTGRTAQPPLNVVRVGFAQIDSFDAAGNESELVDTSNDSTPAFRRYNMDKKHKDRRDNSSESSSDSESESDSDASSTQETPGRQSFGSNPPTPSTTHSTARKSLKSKKSAEKLRAIQFAEKRRKKEVKLNNPKGGIISISSGGGPSLTCFKCGQPGHRAIECKKPGNRQAR